MTPINKITAFECNRRIFVLNQFINTYLRYLDGRRSRGAFEELEEDEMAQIARTQINKTSKEVSSIISASGQTPRLCWSPPPNVGGGTHQINVTYNIFKLSRYMISTRSVIDIIESSVGIYESERKNAWIRTFNPLFWIFRLIQIIASYPFRFIEHIGLPGHKFEASIIGKIFKGIVEMFTGLLVIYTFLDTTGILEHVKNYLKSNQ